MKKYIVYIVLSVMFIFTGCSYGVYSVSSGKPDDAAICFVANKRYPISVEIDGIKYEKKTIKQKPHKARRNIKKIAYEQISVNPGKHIVKVTKGEQLLYSREIFVSATEVKVIEL